jgi:hypothetical protein
VSLIKEIQKTVEEYSEGDHAKLLAEIGEELPVEGVEGSIVGNVIGAWLARGADPEQVKRVLVAIAHVTALELAEAGPESWPQTS